MTDPDEFTVVGYLPIEIDPDQVDETFVIAGRVVAIAVKG